MHNATSLEPKASSKGGLHDRRAMAPLADRNVVFISHANPEDNALAAWYGAKLTAAGYQVWSDITRLLGGEEMWLDIDEVMRFHARKVVALLGRAAADPAKDGVRAELDRAHTYRRKLGDRRFIIPIRIDDVPYDDLPPTISNRTIISGSDNPAAALARVLEILAEDKVPRETTASADALLRWQRVLAPSESSLEAGEDSLVSNWFVLGDLPPHIQFYEINRPLSNPSAEPARIAKAHPVACVAYLRRLVSFAPFDEVQGPIVAETPLTAGHRMLTSEFLSGGDATISISQKEAAKLLMSLLRQSFDILAKTRGLQPFELSERKTAWWVPEGLLPDGKASFVRHSGVPGWRQLTGRYGAKDRVWHFAVNAVPMLGEVPRLRITPHLIYTDPTGEFSPTAEYRRAHAKLWFNAKWRDLIYAMMVVLADGKEALSLPLGSEVHVTMSLQPVEVKLNVRPPVAFERKVKKAAEDTGDTEDLDVSEYASDPALSSLVDPEDEGVENTDGDDALGKDDE